MQDVVVTGFGFVLPNCDDRDAFWQHVRDGKSQLSLEADPASPGEVVAMGRVRDFDPPRSLKDIPPRYYERFARPQLLYVASLVRACADAGLERKALRGDRVGLFDGTSRDNLAFWQDPSRGPLTKRDLPVGMSGMSVGLAAAILGVQGPVYTFSATCASGAVALGHALRELRDGEIDVAFAGGHDAALLGPILGMYRDANLLSRERDDASRALRPFGAHSANAFGEGAVTLVLETREHAAARGARVLARLTGYRYGNCGEHPTNVDETGRRPAELIEQVLGRAGVPLGDVGFVIGHGNGVAASDRSEVAYMRRLFGERAGDVPLLSTKPIYGHTLGASAPLSAAAAALMLDRQYVVPTINVDEELTSTGVTHQANVGAPRECRAGLVVSFGIGGQNAVLLFQREPDEETPSSRWKGKPQAPASQRPPAGWAH